MYMHVYIYINCITDGITVYVYPCMLLAANSSVSFWVNVYTDVMFVSLLCKYRCFQDFTVWSCECTFRITQILGELPLALRIHGMRLIYIRMYTHLL